MKYVSIIVLALLLFAVPVMAQDAGFKFDLGKLNGDMLYLTRSGTLAAGAGISLAAFDVSIKGKTFENVIELRGQYAYVLKDVDTSQSLVGIGAGLNLISLFEMLGGNWTIEGVKPSIGVAAVVDFTDKPRLEPAIYLSVIKLAL
jgi:hypothetical protein